MQTIYMKHLSALEAYLGGLLIIFVALLVIGASVIILGSVDEDWRVELGSFIMLSPIALALIFAFIPTKYVSEWQIYVEDQRTVIESDVLDRWYIKEANGNFITFIPKERARNTEEDCYIQWEEK